MINSGLTAVRWSYATQIISKTLKSDNNSMCSDCSFVGVRGRLKPTTRCRALVGAVRRLPIQARKLIYGGCPRDLPVGLALLLPLPSRNQQFGFKSMKPCGADMTRHDIADSASCRSQEQSPLQKDLGRYTQYEGERTYMHAYVCDTPMCLHERDYIIHSDTRMHAYIRTYVYIYTSVHTCSHICAHTNGQIYMPRCSNTRSARTHVDSSVHV